MKLLDLNDLDAPHGRRLLEATVAMGFSEPVARAGLTAELDAWASPGALEAVCRELPGDLDDARTPASVLVIGARTLPASLMRAVLMARLLGARVCIKPASGTEALAEALAAVDPAVSLSPFLSDDLEARAAAIAAADSVVVLGSDETVASVRAAVPEDRGFVGYGHRLSVAWLDRDDEDALTGLAHDLCAWDQAGCLSPQVAWVTGDPQRLVRRLADAVRAVEATLPMTLPASASHARTSAKTYAEMMGSAVQTETALLATLPTSAFRASPGYRALWVLPADRAALEAVAAHLSTVGVSGEAPEDLPAGVRVCAVGEMQRPPLSWLHDGRPNLLDMLRP